MGEDLRVEVIIHGPEYRPASVAGRAALHPLLSSVSEDVGASLNAGTVLQVGIYPCGFRGDGRVFFM